MNPMRTVVTVALVCVALVRSAEAWWCTGHMLVAEIAREQLSGRSKECAETYLHHISEDFPKAANFSTAACWADDLKDDGIATYDTWHYVNLPFIKSMVRDEVTAVNSEHNVIWALHEANATLNSAKSNNFEKSMSLRFLMHFVGDIHQPLHTITLYSEQFAPPEGDGGGNNYTIAPTKVAGGAMVTELHAFWDSGGGLFMDVNRPMAGNDSAYIGGWAGSIVEHYPKSMFKERLQKREFRDFAAESYALGVDFVYTTPFNGTLSDAYKRQAGHYAQSQIALGGYRLALIIDEFCKLF